MLSNTVNERSNSASCVLVPKRTKQKLEVFFCFLFNTRKEQTSRSDWLVSPRKHCERVLVLLTLCMNCTMVNHVYIERTKIINSTDQSD